MSHHRIEDPTSLRRILDAMLLIEADIDLPVLLHHVIEEARSMTGARYGALGVLNDDGTGRADFITAGLEPDEDVPIRARPNGRGVLGLLVAEPEPLRMAGLDSHGPSNGNGSGHPAMPSILGVPIKVRDEVYGNLYLTDKIGSSEFTAEDEALVNALSVAAGIAIENVRLHRRAQDVAVYDERERLARDLHDTVIQRFFSVGLSLQGIAGTAEAADVSEALNRVILDIDDSICQLRSVVFALGVTDEDQCLRSRVVSLLNELRAVAGFEVHSSFEGPVDTAISDEIADHLLMALREAVTNVARHAQATEVMVHLAVVDSQCQLRIIDNGRGIETEKPSKSGMGLVNLHTRAEKLKGRFKVESPSTGGTVLTWQVPLVASWRPDGRMGDGHSHWAW